MRRLTTLAAISALAIGGLAFDTADYEPVIATERVYAHCGDVEKVANVEGDGSPFATDTTPPAASFQAGAGCGTADIVLTDAVESETREFLEFTATHTGNLDSLTLELHMIDAGIVRLSEVAPTGDLPDDPTGGELPGLAFTEIYADTEVLIFDADGGYEGGFTGEATYPSERSDTTISTRLRMTVTDIGLLDEDEAGEHHITVRIKTADYYNGDSGAWVLDASEVPTGITFNPDEFAPYQVAAF